MNVTFILLGIIGVVYGTLLVGIEFRKWRARIHCRVPVDAVFEKTVTKKMGDRVRTYALFSYHYQEKKIPPVHDGEDYAERKKIAGKRKNLYDPD